MLVHVFALACYSGSASAQAPISRPVALNGRALSFGSTATAIPNDSLRTPELQAFAAITTAPTLPLRRFPDPHDGNYAKRGAIIGALGLGAGSAVIMGSFAKRDCEPGNCDSEFQRGALVGGVVGLAAGSVIGWLVGASIERN